ncbi:Nif3-like dinuclear metal center hexameric protein [Blastopirellula marina]|uniref:GTP cyclohydrolase 1 type 2 homolog n=1 Tax=Blastopirellula marina TaxID=124 RepID=A0A2S8FU88_9BACT|nr:MULTISPECIES: Nif3-like dinuclear metal center hexameric protein [Pirellulaceae]PQO35735.1 Nif3-like dinuclear metal center hexameric protein [Blastopirellula marina]RCS53309.1 Nif3-like dinuclear metal center hexameric protein [Bremerella cremea]
MAEKLNLTSVCEFLERFAPRQLAESWDNVGLLVGDSEQSIEGIVTCLTVTPEVVEEAVEAGADLIVTHHPMPFRPLKQITTDSTVGQMLLKLIQNNIAVYSPHTAFDSCAEGINFQLAKGIGLTDIQPLIPVDLLGDSGLTSQVGTGRRGKFAEGGMPLARIAEAAKQVTGASMVKVVGRGTAEIETVAVGCGSAGELLSAAIENKVDCLILGETSFHTCLEAKAQNVALVLVGHYASERFAVENLATILAEAFPSVNAWSSRQEADPIHFA